MIMMTVETGEPAAAEARISGTVTACPGRAPLPVLLAAVALLRAGLAAGAAAGGHGGRY